MDHTRIRRVTVVRRFSLATLAAFCVAWVTPVAAPQSRPASAHEQAKIWTESALQIESVEKRNAAIESIRVGLGAADTVSQHAALLALSQIRTVDYDKKPFRALVLPHLRGADGEMRRAA